MWFTEYNNIGVTTGLKTTVPSPLTKSVDLNNTPAKAIAALNTGFGTPITFIPITTVLAISAMLSVATGLALFYITTKVINEV